MAENNIIKTPDLGAVNAVDFVEKFGGSIAKLQKALGITRPQPMRQGNEIQTYKFTVTKPSDAEAAKGNVGEGEDIPLTHVKREPDVKHTVNFRKYRKAVTIEEVQRVGYEMASIKTDKQVLSGIQKDIRSDFFTFLATAPEKIEVAGLQEAFGKIWGKLGNIFDDEELGTIVFINPEDAGEYLGEAVISNGQSVGFGLTLLTGFTNVTVMINNSVPKGKVYGTVADNLNLMYIDTNGESSKLFHGKQVYRDELGLIALVKDDNTTNLTEQSTLYLGLTLFAEVTNGVVEATIVAPPVEETP